MTVCDKVDKVHYVYILIVVTCPCPEGPPYMYVFDGTEDILKQNPHYTLVRNYTTYSDGICVGGLYF